MELDLNRLHVGSEVSDAYVDPEAAKGSYDYDREQLAYELVWADEFDYEGAPDETKWDYDVGGGGWGNNELQYYTRGENARVSDGYLNIHLRKEEYGGRSYTSSRLVTRGKQSWLYGKVEVRAKLPFGIGTWPAIWMLPTDFAYGGWPYSGEIDIMEHVGVVQDEISASIHTKSYNHMINTQKTAARTIKGVSEDFHTYTLEWLPDQIIVSVDGMAYFKYAPAKYKADYGSAEWPFDKRMHLLLNIAYGGNWGGMRGVDDTCLPQVMQVDYVRVYQSQKINELTGQKGTSRFTLNDKAVTITDFDKAPAFTSFLPGLTGVRGIPLWVFYCNRGQGISSMGVHHKGNALMEFHPANMAYEKTALEGFRTFIRIGGRCYEPFSPLDRTSGRSMTIHSNALSVTESNGDMELTVHVDYCTLPSAPLGALLRSVTIQNSSGHEQHIEVLDGLPRIIPYGLQLTQFKEMGNLFKSWADVGNLQNSAPMYMLRSSTEDSAKVNKTSGAYFLYSVLDGRAQPIVYDPDVVFGEDTSHLLPLHFMDGGLKNVLSRRQCAVNRIACGFSAVHLRLQPGASQTIDTYVGYTPGPELLNAQLPLFAAVAFAKKKRREAEELAEEMLDDVSTFTAEPMLDAYIRQCYLDNLLRGGYPYVMGRDKVVHLFSRKHGDPERDYNWFAIAGEYYSQGNGNFRDVCQNRRCDVRMKPAVGDYNVWYFFSLIQADGYNPLEIRPATFRVKDRAAAKRLLKQHVLDAGGAVGAVLEGDFTPGMVSGAIAANRVKVTGNEEELINGLLAISEQRIQAAFGEGYWSDHWDYLMDLVEDYLHVYPDKRELLLCGREDYRFFQSGAFVRPRSETAQLTEKGVRCYDSLDTAGAYKQTRWLTDAKGEEVATNLLGKMLTLAVVKTALLDPHGMGISMDGGRPGWNDAMNGLPGLFGSGMPETVELSRLLRFLLSQDSGQTRVPKELALFMRELALVLTTQSPFERWDRANTLLEGYRAGVAMACSGDYETLTMGDILPCLKVYQDRVADGIQSALDAGRGIMPTYFCYHAKAYEPLLDENGAQRLSVSGLPLVKVTAFRQEVAPLFLEGPARYLSVLSPEKDAQAAGQAVKAVRESELYDKALRMYLTSVPLDDMDIEYGRIRAFTAGWLERESVFLHMEYKYLLGMLKAGAYDAFYEAARTALIPFLSPDSYGRSTLENSSFIASSRNPDPHVHGRGFVSRLSGSTAEMLSIWLHLFLGDGGFEMQEGTLSFRFAPRLSAWLFDENGEAGFQLLSHCRVRYINPSRKNTYGQGGAKVRKIAYTLDGAERVMDGDTLAEGLALRDGRIRRLDITLG